MAQYVFTMNRVGKIVPPKRQILKNISLSFFPGAKIGVLGLNGSGKSTLLKIMAGLDHDIEGEATPMPGLKIGFLPQEPQLDPDQTVRQAVEEGIGGSLAAKKRLDEVYAAYGEEGADFDALAAEQAELEAQIAAAGGENTDLQLEIAADALRLAPWDAVVGKLSGGEKRRVALCRMLLSKPDMLLLDEPTNHLDAESVDWLEQFLQRFPGTVVAITHDRYFLDNAAEWILELDRGSGIPYKGNYSTWLEQKEARLEQEQKTEDARTKAMKKELEWVRQNPKGRQAKSKARLARFEELSDIEYQKRNETNEIFIPVADRLGHEVIEFENVSKSFGDRLLIDDLSFKVPAGAIVGIIGPNGAGKSTLFRMIAGKEKPDSGTVKIGADREDGVRRAEPRRPRERQDRLAGRLRRPRQPGRRQVHDAEPRLPRPLQLQGQRPAEARRQPLGRRARAAAPGQDADRRRQRADARRAVERPRRRDPARARGRAARVRRLDHGDQPRPLVPRPHRHPHPGRRGRLEVDLLRRQLPGVRGRQEEAPRRGGRQAEAPALPADAALTQGARRASRDRDFCQFREPFAPPYHRMRRSRSPAEGLPHVSTSLPPPPARSGLVLAAAALLAAAPPSRPFVTGSAAARRRPAAPRRRPARVGPGGAASGLRPPGAPPVAAAPGGAAPVRRRGQGRQAHRRGHRLLAEGRQGLARAASPRTSTSRSSSRSKLKTGIGERGFFGGLMQDSGVVEFRRVHNQMQLIWRNVGYVAKPGTPEAAAIEAGYSPSLLASAPVLSQPEPERKAVLVEANTLFLADLLGIGMDLQRSYRQGYAFDPRNSAITKVRGERRRSSCSRSSATTRPASIAVPQPGPPSGMPQPSAPRSLPDPRSMFLAVHYSLARLPAEPMKGRKADPRVGYFDSGRFDFSNDLERTPRQRFVNRWRLEKKDPAAALSEPVKPIVFWLDRTVPVKYRAGRSPPACSSGTRRSRRSASRTRSRSQIQPDDADFDTLDLTAPRSAG